MPFGSTRVSLGAAVLVLALTGLDLWLLARRTRDPAARQTTGYRAYVAFQAASGVAMAGFALVMFGDGGGGPVGRDLLLFWIGLELLRMLWRWRQRSRGEPVP
jgi:hypothetical protein